MHKNVKMYSNVIKTQIGMSAVTINNFCFKRSGILFLNICKREGRYHQKNRWWL